MKTAIQNVLPRRRSNAAPEDNPVTREEFGELAAKVDTLADDLDTLIDPEKLAEMVADALGTLEGEPAPREKEKPLANRRRGDRGFVLPSGDGEKAAKIGNGKFRLPEGD